MFIHRHGSIELSYLASWISWIHATRWKNASPHLHTHYLSRSVAVSLGRLAVLLCALIRSRSNLAERSGRYIHIHAYISLRICFVAERKRNKQQNKKKSPENKVKDEKKRISETATSPTLATSDYDVNQRPKVKHNQHNIIYNGRYNWQRYRVAPRDPQWFSLSICTRNFQPHVIRSLSGQHNVAANSFFDNIHNHIAGIMLA